MLLASFFAGCWAGAVVFLLGMDLIAPRIKRPVHGFTSCGVHSFPQCFLYSIFVQTFKAW